MDTVLTHIKVFRRTFKWLHVGCTYLLATILIPSCRPNQKMISSGRSRKLILFPVNLTDGVLRLYDLTIVFAVNLNMNAILATGRK